MKTKKLSLVCGVTFSACLSMAFAFLGSTETERAYAEGETVTAITSEKTYEGFEMELGASVRIADENGGMRFTTSVSKAAYEAIEADYEGYKSITFYTLIARADKIEEKSVANLTMELGADGSALSDYVLRCKATNQPNGEADATYKAALVVSDSANYGVELMARAAAVVVDANDQINYIYATSNDNLRTMNEIALAEITDEEVTSDEGLEKYFTAQKATSVSYLEEGATEVSLTLPSLVGEEKVVAAFSSGEKLTADVTEGVKLTNPAELTEGLELGAETSFTLYTDGNNAYTVSAQYVTKAIKTATDLKVFDLANTSAVFDGYYVLANDIDASSYVHAHSSTRPTPNQFRNGTNGTGNAFGLKGTFDGKGHIIDGITLGQYGLFGKIFQATVKNTAFTNVKFVNETMACVLAADVTDNGYGAPNPTFQNLYIQAEELPTGEHSGLLFWRYNPYYMVWKNVIIETPDVSETVGAVTYTTPAVAASNVTAAKNVYIVSPTAGNFCYGNDTVLGGVTEKVCDAMNTVNACDTYKNWNRYETYAEFKKAMATTPDTSFDTTYWTYTNGVPTWKGVTIDTNEYVAKFGGVASENVTLDHGATVTVEMLINGEAQTDVVLTTEDDTIVAIDGVTVEGLAMGKTTVTATCAAFTTTFTVTVQPAGEEVTYETKLLLDATDGTLFNATTGEIVAMNSIFGGDGVTNAIDKTDGTALTVANGKLTGYTLDGLSQAIEREVVLSTNGKWAKVTLTAYTKVIDEASDLAVFNYTGNDAYFNGLYALAKNIDASSYTHVHGGRQSYIANNDENGAGGGGTLRGLVGTFDGRGYTIDGITMDNFGLFEFVMNGAVIKNVALTDVKFAAAGASKATYDDQDARYVLAAYIAYDPKFPNRAAPVLENVYIQTNTIPESGKSSIVAKNIHRYISLKNIIIEVPYTSTTHGSFVYQENNTYYEAPVGVWSDIYMITPTLLALNREGTAYVDASNGTAAHSFYASVKRYDDVAKMKEAGNTYTNFSSDYWTTESGIPVWKTLF